uniref:BHLH domain-containing protein n=1 Tax=Leersia perrieri TaxID=77586 RepID=A0A0D9V177_9ORYZ
MSPPTADRQVFDGRRFRLAAAAAGGGGMGGDDETEVADALRELADDPTGGVGIVELLGLGSLPGEEKGGGGGGVEHLAKRPRVACDGEFVLPPLPMPMPEVASGFIPTPAAAAEVVVPPPYWLVVPELPTPTTRHWQWQARRPDAAALVRGALAAEGTNSGATAKAVVAKERRRRVSDKTAELLRLIPGASKLNSTAEKLRAATLHVKLLQAQVGILALIPTTAAGEEEEEEEEEENAMPSMAMAAEEKRTMRALLASSGVQERLAGEGKCLVPTSLVRAIAGDESSYNPILSRDLNRFINSLQKKKQ